MCTKYPLLAFLLVLPQLSYAAAKCSFGFPEESWERVQIVADTTGQCAEHLRVAATAKYHPCLESSAGITSGEYVGLCAMPIDQEHVRAVYFVAADVRVSKTGGAKFTRDLVLSDDSKSWGAAWTDPSGLTWLPPHSETTSLGNPIDLFLYDDAKSYCQAIGARLPSIDDAKRLQKYLGMGTTGGFSLESTATDIEGSQLTILDLNRAYDLKSSYSRFFLTRPVGAPEGYRYYFYVNGEISSFPPNLPEYSGGTLRCVKRR
jgi:hypothetical protein